jgi:hypothetical protein
MTRLQGLLALAVAATAALTVSGCVQTDPHPMPSATHSSSSSTPSPTPTPVGAPSSSDDAWTEANKTIELFTQIQYDIEHDGGANVNRIDTVASSSAVTSTRQIATDLTAKGLSITGGAAGWQPSAAASSFGTVVDSNGSQIPNGIVYARGCWDLSKQTSIAKKGTPPPDRSVKVFPVQFNVTYFPSDRAWKVTNQTNITGQSGSLQC